jgi:hypothetical protein
MKEEDICDTCKHNEQKIEDNEMAEGKALDSLFRKYEELTKDVKQNRRTIEALKERVVTLNLTLSGKN